MMCPLMSRQFTYQNAQCGSLDKAWETFECCEDRCAWWVEDLNTHTAEGTGFGDCAIIRLRKGESND